MLPPDKLKSAFNKVEEENWMLRAFLKEQDPDEVGDRYLALLRQSKVPVPSVSRQSIKSIVLQSARRLLSSIGEVEYPEQSVNET